jgi:hypothetical protein
MLASPPFAVEREIDGSESVAPLIPTGGGEGLFRRYCCWATTDDRRAACADCCSLLFGEEVKKLDNLFALDVEDLRLAGLSDGGIAAVVLEVLANRFRGSL